MIGIIGAMEDEVALLRGSMNDRHTTVIGSEEYTAGKLGHKEVVLLRCGIGKVNAAAGCTVLINNYHPNFIINIGSSGGIGSPAGGVMRIGDVIIPNGLVYHDFDLTALNYEPGQVPGQPRVFPVNEQLINRAVQAVNELKTEHTLPDELHVWQGLIGCADSFMNKPEAIAHVRQSFPDLLAVDMESTAITHCCRLFYIPIIIIRALSDIAGTESPVEFRDFLSVAAKNSSEIVMRIVRNS
ncbi:MAG: 5'-methylthioadenosine/S-adenosylhomocysteine nucleosidase [Treponema sp.]|nr:5'-methylthioadenosine/S-adenosylhomocysteine nucleosidase [Treponema sp.]